MRQFCRDRLGLLLVVMGLVMVLVLVVLLLLLLLLLQWRRVVAVLVLLLCGVHALRRGARARRRPVERVVALVGVVKIPGEGRPRRRSVLLFRQPVVELGFDGAAVGVVIQRPVRIGRARRTKPSHGALLLLLSVAGRQHGRRRCRRRRRRR